MTRRDLRRLHHPDVPHRGTAPQPECGPALDVLQGIVDEVYPIEAADVERAHTVLRSHTRLSARDALHVAVMQRREVPRILSFDSGFDLVATIERVG
jgi:uncharacterized protein